MELLCEHRLPAYACPRCSSRSVGARCRSRQSFAPLVPARSCTCHPPAGRHGSRLAQAPGQFWFVGFFFGESGAPRAQGPGAREWCAARANAAAAATSCMPPRASASRSPGCWWRRTTCLAFATLVSLTESVRRSLECLVMSFVAIFNPPSLRFAGAAVFLLQLVLFGVQCLFWLKLKLLNVTKSTLLSALTIYGNGSVTHISCLEVFLTSVVF